LAAHAGAAPVPCAAARWWSSATNWSNRDIAAERGFEWVAHNLALLGGRLGPDCKPCW